MNILPEVSMWEFWFKSLRGRMILLALIIVNIPILVAGIAMKHSAEQSLLEEKKSKLAAITVLLDARLGADGYDEIFRRRGVLHGSQSLPGCHNEFPVVYLREGNAGCRFGSNSKRWRSDVVHGHSARLR